jgi:hypothetical protein
VKDEILRTMHLDTHLDDVFGRMGSTGIGRSALSCQNRDVNA